MSDAKRPNIYTRANAGKWVAVRLATGEILARGKNLIAVDRRARAKCAVAWFRLVRVPEEAGA